MSNICFKIEDKTFEIPQDFSNMESFTVISSPRNYDVCYTENTLPSDLVQSLMDENSANLLIADKNVYELHLGNLNVKNTRVFKLEAGEEFKTLTGVSSIIEFLEKNEFTKAGTVIVAGGGITQDVSAFACASYKRGIRWFFLPTTLLSMCDSCIGGKTGINHNKAKNQLGLFSAPHKVIINPLFLGTLSKRDFKSGLGEILKLSITGGHQMLANYSRFVKNGEVSDAKAIKPLILGALWVKKAVVEFDEFEKAHRRSLNYGHTVGHAIETLSNYEIPHGIAVAIGIIIADKLNSTYGRLSEDDRKKMKTYALELMRSENIKNIPTDGIEKLLKKDKKTSGTQLNFAVADSPGNMQILTMELNGKTIEEIKTIIKEEF